MPRDGANKSPVDIDGDRITGTNASSFSLSNSVNVLSAAYPCSLYVAQQGVAAGTYVIDLTANP